MTFGELMAIMAIGVTTFGIIILSGW